MKTSPLHTPKWPNSLLFAGWVLETLLQSLYWSSPDDQNIHLLGRLTLWVWIDSRMSWEEITRKWKIWNVDGNTLSPRTGWPRPRYLCTSGCRALSSTTFTIMNSVTSVIILDLIKGKLSRVMSGALLLKIHSTCAILRMTGKNQSSGDVRKTQWFL